jgi:hypothetical protein
MMAARMVARLAGPLPVRRVAASSRMSSGCVCLDGPVLADEAGQVLIVAGAGQAVMA